MTIDFVEVAGLLGLKGGWVIAFLLFAWFMFAPDKVERVRVLLTGALAWTGAYMRRGLQLEHR